MKMFFLNRKPCHLLLGAALVVSTLFISCSKDDNDMTNETYAVSGNASGSQVNPSTNSTATGTFSGAYNRNTNQLQYNVSWSNLTNAAGLVQVYGPAGTGVNGNLMFSLAITTPGMSGSANGSITLTDTQETALLANNTYYTVSTTAFTAGEIRGQITATAN